MSTETYYLTGTGPRLRPGTMRAARAATIEAARLFDSDQIAGEESAISTFPEALDFFGIENSGPDTAPADAETRFPFCLADSRPAYIEPASGDIEPGVGHYVLAQIIAPYVLRGCWSVYESDGSPWAIVWDGTQAYETPILPDPALAGLTVSELLPQ